tara:strand:+ start:15691 stop:16749 length:1059 start_codon:yes stop_codon:yes gene_type:complete
MGNYHHKAVGSVLTQTEFEATDGTTHQFASQATGMLQYASSATVLTSLAIGSTNDTLQVVGGIPAWVTSPKFTAVLANSDDGGAIGASGTAFSDLFLASGAVINFNAGAETITHSANTITFGGITTFDIGNAALNNIGDAGNDWTANSLKLINTNTGGDNLIKVENTATSGNSSATLAAKVDEGSSRHPALLLSIEASAGDVHWLAAINNASSDRYSLSNSGTVGTNDAFRITNATPPVLTYNTTHPTGTFDYVCDSCGRHGLEFFSCCGTVEWQWDAPVALAAMEGEEWAIDRMALIGVMERTFDNDGRPEVFTKLGLDVAFAWSIGGQNWREIQALKGKISELEAQLEAA